MGDDVTSTDNGAVRYTVKELLMQVNTRLASIESKLDSKADKNLVDILAQKIEQMRLPPDLIKEHAQLLLEAELQKQHKEWSDKELGKLKDDNDKLRSFLDILQRQADANTDELKLQKGASEQSSSTRKWILGLVLGNIAQATGTAYAIFHH